MTEFEVGQYYWWRHWPTVCRGIRPTGTPWWDNPGDWWSAEFNPAAPKPKPRQLTDKQLLGFARQMTKVNSRERFLLVWYGRRDKPEEARFVWALRQAAQEKGWELPEA